MRKINLNDLINVYLITKIRKGLIPEISEQELNKFITFFHTHKQNLDLQRDNN